MSVIDNRKSIDEQDGKTCWYIKKVDGTMVGPFPSSDSAHSLLMSESINGQVVQGTAGGKEFLIE